MSILDSKLYQNGELTDVTFGELMDLFPNKSFFPALQFSKKENKIILWVHDDEVVSKVFAEACKDHYTITKIKSNVEYVFESEEYFKIAVTALRIAYPDALAFINLKDLKR